MEATHEHRIILESTAGRSAASTVEGAGAVVLCILGLAGILPTLMEPVSVLVIGTMLAFKGAALSAEYSNVLTALENNKLEKAQLSGGLSAELVGGATGIVLGILALLGIASLSLDAVAVIVFGAAITFSGGSTRELNAMKISSMEVSERARHVAEQSVNAAIGAQALVGLGAIVLGILALIGMTPHILILVALLSLGGASLLTGAAMGGRLATMFRHTPTAY